MAMKTNMLEFASRVLTYATVLAFLSISDVVSHSAFATYVTLDEISVSAYDVPAVVQLDYGGPDSYGEHNTVSSSTLPNAPLNAQELAYRTVTYQGRTSTAIGTTNVNMAFANTASATITTAGTTLVSVDNPLGQAISWGLSQIDYTFTVYSTSTFSFSYDLSSTPYGAVDNSISGANIPAGHFPYGHAAHISMYAGSSSFSTILADNSSGTNSYVIGPGTDTFEINYYGSDYAVQYGAGSGSGSETGIFSF